MAPNFTPAQRELIRCMLSDEQLSNAVIACRVPFRCSKTAVQRIRIISGKQGEHGCPKQWCIVVAATT